MFTHYLLITGCELPGDHGDGFCHDINNNEACFFDGGDCCGSDVTTWYCSVCQCLEEGGGGSGGTVGACNQYWKADGECDDINNNVDCSYDGGDCCGSNVNTQHCTLCLCLEGSTTPSTTTTAGACNQVWIADGFCDDYNNNLDCSYDGGDCCGSNVNTQYCSVCQCLEGG